jgi:hypothetical protein
MSDRMAEWVRELRSRDDIVEGQIVLWKREVATQGQALSPSMFPCACGGVPAVEPGQDDP